jgi:hypothetical protein
MKKGIDDPFFLYKQDYTLLYNVNIKVKLWIIVN